MNKVVKYGIELLVILVVLVAAFYGISKISTAVMRDKDNKQEILVTFEVQRQEEEILSKVKMGDMIVDNIKTTPLGKVVALSENKPARYSAKDYEKKAFVITPIEGYYDKEITVAITADLTDTAIMAGETELKIGYSLPLINENYQLVGTVIGMEFQEESKGGTEE